jgi:hypothetical protein
MRRKLQAGDARDRAQEALSRARLSQDARRKQAWQELAAAWLQMVEALEEAPAPDPRRGKPHIVVSEDN